ncbi:DUF4258 domain-containing protein [Spirochaetota bacterium]
MKSNYISRFDKLNKIIYSYHGQLRASGRGISESAIEYILLYGSIFYAGDNATAYWLNNKALKSSKCRDKSILQHSGKAVIVSHDGVVITAMHCKKTPKHWEKAA